MLKGLALVPVFFPKECEPASRILVDRETRSAVGIAPTNEFIFAYTSHSNDGTVGYNEIKDVCEKINIPVLSAKGLCQM